MTCQLTSGEYPSIRIALGLAGSDTTSLPDDTIEAMQYLPDVTARVNAALTDAAGGCFSCDDEDDDYDATKTVHAQVAIVLLVAAEIALGFRSAAGDGRITSQALGDLKVTYGKTEWAAVAADARARGLAALARACPEAAGLYAGDIGAGVAPDMMVTDGPSKGKTKRELAEARDDVFVPWVLGGP